MGWVREGGAGLAASAEYGPDAFDRVELGRVRWQVVSSEPFLAVDERVQSAVAVDGEVDPGRGSGLVDRSVSPGRFPRPACPFPSTGRSTSPVQNTCAVLIPGRAMESG